MSITQVDRDENAVVQRVYASVPVGAHKGEWCLERVDATEPEPEIDAPGWRLVRHEVLDYDMDTGRPSCLAPVEAWFARESDLAVDGPQVAFVHELGWQMARVMFRRFGIVEPQWQPPPLSVIHGDAT